MGHVLAKSNQNLWSPMELYYIDLLYHGAIISYIKLYITIWLYSICLRHTHGDGTPVIDRCRRSSCKLERRYVTAILPAEGLRLPVASSRASIVAYLSHLTWPLVGCLVGFGWSVSYCNGLIRQLAVQLVGIQFWGLWTWIYLHRMEFQITVLAINGRLHVTRWAWGNNIFSSWGNTYLCTLDSSANMSYRTYFHKLSWLLLQSF